MGPGDENAPHSPSAVLGHLETESPGNKPRSNMEEHSDVLNVSYKHLHERFVSDLNGTSLLEIGTVASSAPAAFILRTIVFNVLFSKQGNFSSSLFCW